MRAGLTGIFLLAAVVLLPDFGLFRTGPLQAQTFQLDQASKEKSPTPRDPRYSDPMIPPQFRDKSTSEPTPGLLLNPQGNIDTNAILNSRRQKDLEKEKASAEIRIRRYDDIPEGSRHVILQKSILRQFGVDYFPHSWREEIPYTETPTRRFQITFFLSLPITMGVSYGLLHLSHVSTGQSTRSYSAGETVAMATVGIGLSSWMAWYDLDRYRAHLRVRANRPPGPGESDSSDHVDTPVDSPVDSSEGKAPDHHQGDPEDSSLDMIENDLRKDYLQGLAGKKAAISAPRSHGVEMGREWRLPGASVRF